MPRPTILTIDPATLGPHPSPFVPHPATLAPRPLPYYYRRRLTLTEQLPAIGAAAAVGAAAFYIVRLLLQKTPLDRDDRIAQVGRRGEVYHRPRRERIPR